MADMDRVVVIGAGSFTKSVANAVDREPGYALDSVVTPDDPLPKAVHLLISLVPPEARLDVAQRALAAGLLVVTLPFVTAGEPEYAALNSGRVVQISPLRGFGVVEALRTEIKQEALGRPYGLFATYRVRQGTPGLIDDAGVPLLHLATDLIDAPFVRVHVTPAQLFSDDVDAWFVVAAAADETVATIEIAASLPVHAPAPEQILIEATGSDAVLRAEPTRQRVTVYNQDGRASERGWWPDLGDSFVEAAISDSIEPNADRETSFLRFLAALYRSLETGDPVDID